MSYQPGTTFDSLLNVNDAVNAAKNAGILAAQIIGVTNTRIAEALHHYKENMKVEVLTKAAKMKDNFKNNFDENL